MDVSIFLRKYAQHYEDVDKLYNIARDTFNITRKEFVSVIEEAFTNPEIIKHIYTELPFKHHYTNIVAPSGKRIGMIKWTDNPRFVGK